MALQVLRDGHPLLCCLVAQGGKSGPTLGGSEVGSASGGRAASASGPGGKGGRSNDFPVLGLVLGGHRPTVGSTVCLGGGPRRRRGSRSSR